MIKIGFIGAGIVATTLATALHSKGYSIVAVSSRSRRSSDRLAKSMKGCRSYSSQGVADNSGLVFITTPDDAIARVVTEVRWRPEQSIIHCSGADSTAILSPARKVGACVGVFHPLQTFTSSRQERLTGITYAIEADKPLLVILKEMATTLGGRWIELKQKDKVLYHTAAVFACNYLVTLLKVATDLWQHLGIPPKQANLALLPLLKGTINNIENTGIPRCLTGPISRGDNGTIKKHLEALQEAAPELVTIYRELGLKTIPIALAKGKIDKEQANKLQFVLNQTGEGSVR
ncbi:MAG: DUF2520 domain-containing protein [Dehalococcoidia bacterium]|nr:MAG: DUF2520 domain-containing protein [Dehalococcoidia bacterium]